MPLRARTVLFLLSGILACAVPGWTGYAAAADRGAIAVSVNVISQCTVESTSPVSRPDPRAALRATRVTCAAATPYEVTAARADHVPALQASWAAGPDGTVLVTVSY